MADIYVRITNEPVHRTSCHSDNTVNVDLDANGVPVGVEVLNAIGLEVDGQPVNLPEASAKRPEEELLHDVARAIRDAYEQLPDGTAPDFTDVHEWYGEARAALAVVRGEAS